MPPLALVIGLQAADFVKRLIIIIAVLVIAVPLVLSYGSFRGEARRDWAEVTLLSSQTSPDGTLTASLSERHSFGAGIEFRHYLDGVPKSGGMNKRGTVPFFPSRHSVALVVHPGSQMSNGQVTNLAFPASCLLLHPGQTRRIYTGESLLLYDYTNGVSRYSGVYRVIPRNAQSAPAFDF